jgi:hypothetical protein
MNFGKLVEKSSRGLFLFIAIMMILPLVLWGYMNPTPADAALQGTAGVIFGKIEISRARFEEHRRKAYPSWWWNKIEREPWILFQMMRGQRAQGPAAEEIRKQAWRDIILLQDAAAKGISATELEVARKIRDVYTRVTFGRQPFDMRTLERLARDVFGAPMPVFEAWARDQVVIDKLLDLVAESSFARHDEAYADALQSRRLVKLWYAAFDPQDFVRDLKPVTADEIARYYEQNKSKFRVPEKANVSYLMIEFETLQKKAPEPSEEERRKSYEENKQEFRAPHEHKPGEEHRDDEAPTFRPFEEVRAEVAERVRRRWAEKEASRLMDQVNVDLGADAAANGGKFSDDVFEKLKEKYKAQGVDLVHDVTPSFDRRSVDDVEKTVGSNSGLALWAFDRKNREGDISQKITTSKGVVLFRLLKRKDAYDPGLTEQVRERIVKVLQREQVRKRTQQAAANVVQEINTRGFAAGRRRHPAEWRPTRYFNPAEGDPGVADASLGGMLRRQAAGLAPGKAAVVPGTAVSGARDKENWSYVVYLEDSVEVVPDDLEREFRESLDRLTRERRERRREEYAAQLVQAAEIKEDPGLKNAEPRTSAP